MAHFARIEDGIVREVIVVNNEVILNDNGQEQESIGIAFCKSLYGEDTEWVQTSFHGSFRGKFGIPSMIYNRTTDTFENPTEA